MVAAPLLNSSKSRPGATISGPSAASSKSSLKVIDVNASDDKEEDYHKVSGSDTKKALTSPTSSRTTKPDSKDEGDERKPQSLASSFLPQTIKVDSNSRAESSASILSNQVTDVNIASSDDKASNSYITECANAWSTLGFILTTSYTALEAAYAFSGEVKYSLFYAWVMVPIAVTGMALSFALKPRRNNFAYKAFLFAQYAIFAFGSRFFYAAGSNWNATEVIGSVTFFIIWLAFYPVALRIRGRVAQLSDNDLNQFLSGSVIQGGLVVGFGQLLFLAFSSLQCKSEASLEGQSWKKCRRGLYAQAGLGCLVAIFVIIKLVAGVAPRKYLDKHTITIEKITTLDLNLEQCAQVLGLSIAGGCGLFLLGNYGVEGDFSSKDQKWYFAAVMVTGVCSLVITAIFEGLLIRSEIKSDQENAENYQANEVNAIIVEGAEKFAISQLSSLWIGVGVAATTIQTGVNISYVFTYGDLNDILETVLLSLLPIVIVLYILSVFAQPRRNNLWFLRLHFATSFLLSLCFLAPCAMVNGDAVRDALIYVSLGAGFSVFFHFTLKLRAIVGQLPNSDLSEFLIKTLFKGGIQTLASVLFILFRSFKCVGEAQLKERDEKARSC